jgi:hypothetical protein
VYEDMLRLRTLDTDAESLESAQSRQAVLASEEAGDLGVPFGDAAQHESTMGDRLVARYGDFTGDAFAGVR